MSEYWISPPHFGPLGAKNTTVVHTPRNIDLPAHVVLSPELGGADSSGGGILQKQQKKKKYLCLSFWLMGLALLTTGAIIVALFLVPETELAVQGNSDSRGYLTLNCLDLLPLEDKVKNSEVVCVGSMLPDMSLKVDQVIKGDMGRRKFQISPAGKSCFEATSSPQVFFLSPERQSRSVKDKESIDYWMPKYRALVASEKAVDIITHLASSENKELLVSPKLESTEAGVCSSSVERQECHQIDHCQLVNDLPDGQCTCQDISCRQGGEEENNQEEPVCGSDHVTYKNQCQLKNAACGKQLLNLTQIASVPCEDAGLCGLNGCPYHAKCLRDANKSRYTCQCPDCYTPITPSYVCGDDGVSYQGLCQLHQASCLLQKEINFDYDGQCRKCPECPYGSTCFRGHCKCPTDCPSQYQPVCGTDGRTYNNECWMMQQTCNQDKIVEVQSKGQCLHPSHSCVQRSQEDEEVCTCPHGVDSPRCDKCLPGFWAYTTFGCLDCGCAIMGSDKGKCDAYTGKCTCKPGFSGDKCEICPDGSTSTPLDGCPNRSTKYAEPLACGKKSCDFGAKCNHQDCICEINCQDSIYYPEPVCGNDGNTYRSECQLRQYSCRIQKEIVVAKYEPCTDAPYLYGQQDILSDGTGTVTVYGLIGDKCLDNRDCFIDSTSCNPDGYCACESGYKATSSNLTCLAEEESLCDPNPCQGGGTCEEHDGTFSCYCPPGLAGSHCQHDVSQASINIASFTGQSWVGLAIAKDALVNRFDLDFSFRSFSEDGILFYAQGSQDNDFLSLSLKNRFAEFRYDLGSGPLVLKTNIQIQLGQWHRLVAKRYNQDGFLSLDNSDKVTGQAVGSIKTLNVDEIGFMGGIDPDLQLDAREKAGIATGFIGCLKEVQMGGPRQSIRLESEFEPKILQRRNVIECNRNPCSRMPCANGGSCQAHHQHQGYQCTCKSNFTGRQCQSQRDSCHPNPCLHHGQCILDDLRGFLCRCKKDFTGRLCQTMITNEDEDEKRYRKSLLQDDKEKIQFSLKTNISTINDHVLSIPLEQTNTTLKMGLDQQEFWIELLGMRKSIFLGENFLVPNSWHKVVVIKHHHKIHLRIDHQHHILHFHDISKISFDDSKPLQFPDSVIGNLCLRNFHIVKWKNGRKSKSPLIDICI